jgi:septal ring factor EnvC (AmiA/AmiB activator)
MSAGNDGYGTLGMGFIIDRLDSLKDDIHNIHTTSEVTLQKLENHFKEDSQNLENITKSLESVQEQLEVYNQELKIHIAGVNELRRNNDLLEKNILLNRQELEQRLSLTEAPIKWLKTTKSIALWITAVAAAGTILISLLSNSKLL